MLDSSSSFDDDMIYDAAGEVIPTLDSSYLISIFNLASPATFDLGRLCILKTWPESFVFVFAAVSHICHLCILIDWHSIICYIHVGGVLR